MRALSPEIAPLAPGEELIDADSFETLQSGTAGPGWRPIPLAVQPPADTAWRRVEAVRRAPREPDFDECRTRREADRLAVRRARAHVEAAAVFLARRGGIQALCCDPAPARPPGAITWQGHAHALADVLERRKPWRGALALDPLTRRILRTVGREGVREIALLPVSVRERLVGFLYADAGDGTLSHAGVHGLEAIARRLGDAWTRLILERKEHDAVG